MINLCQTEIETSNNNLVSEYMPNKVSIRVCVSSSKKEHVQFKSVVQKSPVF